MPEYEFEAMDATGMEIRDKIAADSEDEAQKIIRQMGYFVTKIVISKPKIMISKHPRRPEITVVWPFSLNQLYYGIGFILVLALGIVIGLAIATG